MLCAIVFTNKENNIDIISIPGFSDPFSSISHLVGSCFWVFCSFILIYQGRGSTTRIIGLVIYSFCLIFLFSMSGIYHLLDKGGLARYVLRILDYTGIYGLIAGTFTPIHLILFRGLHRWLILFIVWALSIFGLTFTAIFFDSLPTEVSLLCFLGLGWVGIFSAWGIYKFHSKELLLYTAAGGLSYTFGAIFEFFNWPVLIKGIIGPHEIFHVFVLIGAFFHWLLVYKIAKYPVSSSVTFLVKEYPDHTFEAEATSEHISFDGKSKEEIKEKVQSWIKENFHSDMKPETIRFKYLKEELIKNY